MAGDGDDDDDDDDDGCSMVGFKRKASAVDGSSVVVRQKLEGMKTSLRKVKKKLFIY
jgi:hypothetical protein